MSARAFIYHRSGGQSFYPFRRLNDQLHGTCQHFITPRGDLCGQERILVHFHAPSQTVYPVAFQRQVRIGQCRCIGQSQCRVEPSQAAVPPRLAVSPVGQDVAFYPKGYGHPAHPTATVLYLDAARVLSWPCLLRNIHSEPQGLYFSLRHVHLLAESLSVGVHPFGVEAGDGRCRQHFHTASQVGSPVAYLLHIPCSRPQTYLERIILVGSSCTRESSSLLDVQPLGGDVLTHADGIFSVFGEQVESLLLSSGIFLPFVRRAGHLHGVEAVELRACLHLRYLGGAHLLAVCDLCSPFRLRCFLGRIVAPAIESSARLHLVGQIIEVVRTLLGNRSEEQSAMFVRHLQSFDVGHRVSGFGMDYQIAFPVDVFVRTPPFKLQCGHFGRLVHLQHRAVVAE
ncbi:hypothetical protein EVA_05841 [gut metagenome]|uniref:Uncharacterized protein n=1 Tax=gut metagenome TaxID=749906 RepID=J9GFC7_9ZZZZ